MRVQTVPELLISWLRELTFTNINASRQKISQVWRTSYFNILDNLNNIVSGPSLVTFSFPDPRLNFQRHLKAGAALGTRMDTVLSCS